MYEVEEAIEKKRLLESFVAGTAVLPPSRFGTYGSLRRFREYVSETEIGRRYVVLATNVVDILGELRDLGVLMAV